MTRSRIQKVLDKITNLSRRDDLNLQELVLNSTNKDFLEKLQTRLSEQTRTIKHLELLKIDLTNAPSSSSRIKNLYAKYINIVDLIILHATKDNSIISELHQAISNQLNNDLIKSAVEDKRRSLVEDEENEKEDDSKSSSATTTNNLSDSRNQERKEAPNTSKAPVVSQKNTKPAFTPDPTALATQRKKLKKPVAKEKETDTKKKDNSNDPAGQALQQIESDKDRMQRIQRAAAQAQKNKQTNNEQDSSSEWSDDDEKKKKPASNTQQTSTEITESLEERAISIDQLTTYIDSILTPLLKQKKSLVSPESSANLDDKQVQNFENTIAKLPNKEKLLKIFKNIINFNNEEMRFAFDQIQILNDLNTDLKKQKNQPEKNQSREEYKEEMDLLKNLLIAHRNAMNGLLEYLEGKTKEQEQVENLLNGSYAYITLRERATRDKEKKKEEKIDKKVANITNSTNNLHDVNLQQGNSNMERKTPTQPAAASTATQNKTPDAATQIKPAAATQTKTSTPAAAQQTHTVTQQSPTAPKTPAQPAAPTSSSQALDENHIDHAKELHNILQNIKTEHLQSLSKNIKEMGENILFNAPSTSTHVRKNQLFRALPEEKIAADIQKKIAEHISSLPKSTKKEDLQKIIKEIIDKKNPESQQKQTTPVDKKPLGGKDNTPGTQEEQTIPKTEDTSSSKEKQEQEEQSTSEKKSLTTGKEEKPKITRRELPQEITLNNSLQEIFDTLKGHDLEFLTRSDTIERNWKGYANSVSDAKNDSDKHREKIATLKELYDNINNYNRYAKMLGGNNLTKEQFDVLNNKTDTLRNKIKELIKKETDIKEAMLFLEKRFETNSKENWGNTSTPVRKYSHTHQSYFMESSKSQILENLSLPTKYLRMQIKSHRQNVENKKEIKNENRNNALSNEIDNNIQSWLKDIKLELDKKISSDVTEANNSSIYGFTENKITILSQIEYKNYSDLTRPEKGHSLVAETKLSSNPLMEATPGYQSSTEKKPKTADNSYYVAFGLDKNGNPSRDHAQTFHKKDSANNFQKAIVIALPEKLSDKYLLTEFIKMKQYSTDENAISKAIATLPNNLKKEDVEACLEAIGCSSTYFKVREFFNDYVKKYRSTVFDLSLIEHERYGKNISASDLVSLNNTRLLYKEAETILANLLLTNTKPIYFTEKSQCRELLIALHNLVITNDLQSQFRFMTKDFYIDKEGNYLDKEVQYSLDCFKQYIGFKANSNEQKPTTDHHFLEKRKIGETLGNTIKDALVLLEKKSDKTNEAKPAAAPGAEGEEKNGAAPHTPPISSMQINNT